MGLASSIPEYAPVVETKSGPVRGKVFRVEDEKIVDGYLGIPYAEPPVGELRFKRPVPVKPWNETKDCVQFGPRAPQVDEFFAQYLNIVGKDEAGCLTLNVMAPRWKSDEWPDGLPVMVWIHGGGFAVHSSSNYGDSTVARNLCVKDIVFVSINYRLGALGFFTTGDDQCKGNRGLWDQTLALKWVQENISKFGGDPDNVTIFGQSAGGASVDLLCLSPHSKDLFRRAIPMAGTAENDFAIRSKAAMKSVGREFARFLGWDGDQEDSEGLLKWMSQRTINQLELGMTGMHEKKRFIQSQAGYLAFVPNLDGDFFPAPLSELRKNMTKMEVMTGTTQFEGLFFAVLGNIPKSFEGMRKFSRTMLKEVDYGSEFKEIQKDMVDFYVKDVEEKDRHKLIEKHIQMIGDVAICNGVFNYAKKMSSLGHNVYFYSFEYCNPDGFGVLRWLMPFRASTHCTELRYILGKGVISKFSPNEDDKKMIQVMTNYFSNFAKYGNPNGKDGSSEWRLHSHSDPFKHFKIQLGEAKMHDNYQDRRADFWNEKILPKNNVRPNLF